MKPEDVHPGWMHRLGASAAMRRFKHLVRRQERCLFCEAKATSKEDVWPVWIVKSFSAPTFGMIGTVGDALYLDAKQKKVRIRCVCRQCNNVWMSQLEQDARPVLALMARDFALSLSLDQRALIAAWAVKTAMVWDPFGPKERRPFYLEWDRANMRISRTIPENTTVWLARYGGTPCLWSSLADATADPRHPMPDTTLRAALTTIIFGRLCIQVRSYRTLMIDSRVNLSPLRGPWDDCAVTIWPTTQRHTVDWPPKLTLERDVSLDAFCRRWLQLSEI
jgi:hypothetical protein